MLHGFLDRTIASAIICSICIYDNKVQMVAKRPLFLELVLKRIFLKKDNEIFTQTILKLSDFRNSSSYSLLFYMQEQKFYN